MNEKKKFIKVYQWNPSGEQVTVQRKQTNNKQAFMCLLSSQ